MAESIIGRLKIVSIYLPREPDLCIACITASELERIREDIRKLRYNDFLQVLNYVKDSNLPPDFKQELEIEYNIRKRGWPKN